MLKSYQSENKLSRKARETTSYKVKEKHVKYAIKYLEKEPGLSISRLWKKL